MAEVAIHFEMGVACALRLTESEMRALDGLTGYGDDAFLEAFKSKLGAVYIRDHEAGLRSFFRAVRRDVIPALADITQARDDLRKAREARRQKVTDHDA